MPLTETFEFVDGKLVAGGLENGKVVPGRTWLRDPQTSELLPVLSLFRGEHVQSSDYLNRGIGADEQNAMNGGGRTHGARGQA